MDHLPSHPLNPPTEIPPTQIPSFCSLLRTHHLYGSADWPPLFLPLHISPLCSYDAFHRTQTFLSQLFLIAFKKKKKKTPTFVDWHKKPSRMRPLASSFSLILPHSSATMCVSITQSKEQSPLSCLCTCCSLYLSCSYLYPAAAPHLPQD